MATYTFDAVVVTATYDPATEERTYLGAVESPFVSISGGSSDTIHYVVNEELSSGALDISLQGMGRGYYVESSEFGFALGDLDEVDVDLFSANWGAQNSVVLAFTFQQYDDETETYAVTQVLVHVAGDAFPPIENLDDYLEYRDSVSSYDAGIPEGFRAGDEIDLSAVGNGTMSEVDDFTGSARNDTVDLGAGDDRYNGLLGNDTARGGAGNDIIYGAAGSDHLFGGAGNDSLNGGAGYDTLFGGRGNDVLNGGNSGDTLNGYTGHDRLFGGQGNDMIYGHDGNDFLNGGNQNDALYGGNGADRLLGGNGNDLLKGGAKNDALGGGAGRDHIYGDGGHDRMFGGNGHDHLYGGAGNDRLNGGHGNDFVYGGDGADTFVFDGNDTNDLRLSPMPNFDRIGDLEAIDTIEISSVTMDDVVLTATTERVYVTIQGTYVIEVAGTTDIQFVEDQLVFV